MADGRSSELKKTKSDQTPRDSSISEEYYDSVDVIHQPEVHTEAFDAEGAVGGRPPDQSCYGLACNPKPGDEGLREMPNEVRQPVSRQRMGPNKQAEAHQNDGTNTSDTLNEVSRRQGSSTHTMPSDKSRPRPFSYHICPYHNKRSKYLIDHYCNDHGCRVCKKCAKKSNHRKCDIVLDQYKHVKHGSAVNEETTLSVYQVCPYHKDGNHLTDHVCKHHCCLMCPTCGIRKHAKCETGSLIAVSRTLNMKEEVYKFKKSVVNNLKHKVLLLKEKLDDDLNENVKTERQKIKEDAQEMFQYPTPDNERSLTHISAELQLIWNNQIGNLGDHMKLVEEILLNTDDIYKEIEKVEDEYKDSPENVFIAIYNLVPDLNKCVNDFQQVQSDVHLISLKIRTPGRFFNKIAVKKDLVPYKETPVKCFKFPVI